MSEPRTRLWSPRHSLWLVLAVALAGVLRLAALERYPPPVNEDELSNIYDGWSIAETGADRSGRHWPILCRGWGPGDNRPALMAWLCAGVSSFAGFSVGGCRAVSGVVGTITVALVGVWAVGVVGRRAALLGMLLLAVSPWQVLFSRLAHEGTALPGLFAVVIVLLLRWAAGCEDGVLARGGADAISVTSPMKRSAGTHWRWLAAGLVIGFSTNAYGATRLTGLLFAVLAAVIAFVSNRVGIGGARRIVGAIACLVIGAGVGAGPQIYAMLVDFDLFVGRARMTQTAFFGWLDFVETFVTSAVANLSPRYLFYSFGEAYPWTVGRCSVVALPLFYAGLIWLVLPWSRVSWLDRLLLLGGLLICVSPPTLTRATPHPLRASGCAVLIPMVSTIGLAACGRMGALALPGANARRRELIGDIAAGAFAVLILVAGAWYVGRFTGDADLRSLFQQPQMVSLGRWLTPRVAEYDRVYVVTRGNQPDLYLAAFTGMTPPAFQSAERPVWGERNEYAHQLNRFRIAQYLKDVYDDRRRADPGERWLVVDAHRTMVREFGPDRPIATGE